MRSRLYDPTRDVQANGSPDGQPGSGLTGSLTESHIQEGMGLMIVSRISLRRTTLAAAALSSSLAVLLILMVVSAQAFDLHRYLSTPHITEVPPSSGAALSGAVTALNSMTVNKGHLWIAESMSGMSTSRIDEFNAETGLFMRQLPQVSGFGEFQFGVAVGDSTGEGEVYVGARESSGERRYALPVFNEATGAFQAAWTGTSAGAFEVVNQFFDVAVDKSSNASDPAAGFVYVLAGGGAKSVVDVFEPEAAGKEKYVTQIGGISESQPFYGGFDGDNPRYIAVDPSTGDLIVAGKEIIDIFKPIAGTPVEYQFVRAIIGTPGGAFSYPGLSALAVDSNGEIYVGEPAAERNDNKGAVYEFSLTGEYLGRTTGQATPEGTFGVPGPMSLAVDPVTHNLFVGVYHQDKTADMVDAFSSNIVVPDVETAAATGEKPTGAGTIEATLNGTIETLGEGQATCDFVWGTSKDGLEGEEHETTACEAPVTGGGKVAVRAKVFLQPDVTYFFRLQATNKNGTNPGEAWQDQSFTAEGPGLRSAWATEVGASTATLSAAVDPNGAPTSVFFQYGPSAAYGMETAAVAVGSGSGNVEVSQKLANLVADLGYHYRLVSSSELQPEKTYTFYGPDQAFATQPLGSPLALLDGRQWELVSPADKHGGKLIGLGGKEHFAALQAAADGPMITYPSVGATEEGAQGASGWVQVLSRRNGTVWQSEDISTSSAQSTSVPPAGEYRFFSRDLSTALVVPWGPFSPLEHCESDGECTSAAFPPATGHTIYLRHNLTCATEPTTCYEPLVTSAPGYADITPSEEGGECEASDYCAVKTEQLMENLAATSNGLHVVFDSETAKGVVEWSAEKPSSERLSSEATGKPGVRLVGLDARNAISDDGGRVFWNNPRDTPGYVEVTDFGRKETLRVGSGQAVFEAATSDGSAVFFTEPGKLYVCRITEEAGKLSCELTDLSPRGNTVGNIVFPSNNGSYVYFEATGVLTEEANAAGENPVAGSPNLYMRHYNDSRREWEEPRLVAVLSPEDQSDWDGNGGLSDSSVDETTMRLSGSGEWLTFMSKRPLTAYDNRDRSPAASGARDQEVFLYNAQSGTVACVSCNPTGARPTGMQSSPELVGGYVDNPAPEWFSAFVPRWNQIGQHEALHQPRYLANDGRVFFDSAEALVPQDVNGQVDVYEYEPPSVGSCAPSSATYSKQDGGCINLISSGESAWESAFLDASESGSDVFFLTRSKLVGEDHDTAYDVYDAHVCTAEAPCLSGSTETQPCSEAESCREAPQGQPSIFGPPSSATFSAKGDVKPSKPKPNKLTRKQRLRLALRACRRRHPHEKAMLYFCMRRVRHRLRAHAYARSNRHAHTSRMHHLKTGSGRRGR